MREGAFKGIFTSP